MALDPARAAVRLAVRPWLEDAAGTVLVACSGGADSLALLAAAVFEGARAGVPVVGAVVDHGLQAGSADHTARVVEQMAALGVTETASVRVTVDPGPAGIEAGARLARYAALSRLASHVGSELVLLGHTLDDQAETVLLGLARGSGGRSLQGMRPAFTEDGVLVGRPLLRVRREVTEAACRADAITWWDDPQNSDPGFLRARVRHHVLPVLERELGPGVAAALARTGELLREDVETIDELVDDAYARLRRPDGLDLGQYPLAPAVRRGAVRRAAIDAGAIASELTLDHVLAVIGLLGRTGKQVRLPGHVTAYAEGAVLLFRPTPTG